VGSLQEHVPVKLILEEWLGAPTACGDGWDEEAKGKLYLRGMISVNMGSVGSAVGGLRLVGGVGDYAVRVYARNREQVVRLYHELFDRHGDPLGDDFQRARKDLENLEQYLIQLWRQS
jgi:hypothetical protein